VSLSLEHLCQNQVDAREVEIDLIRHPFSVIQIPLAFVHLLGYAGTQHIRCRLTFSHQSDDIPLSKIGDKLQSPKPSQNACF